MSKERKKSKHTKEARLFDNFMKVTEQFMRGRTVISLTEQELMDKLAVLPEYAKIYRQVLKRLVDEGLIIAIKGRYMASQTHDSIVAGILRVHPRGFGFLQADTPSKFDQDIFIPKNYTQNAVDGDRVEVQVNTDAISEKGPEGRVIAILERSRSHAAGTICRIDIHDAIYAYAPLLGAAQKILVDPWDERALQVGDRIIMEITQWGKDDEETTARVSHYLGHISDPSIDIVAAIEEYDLRGDFPIEVIEEAQSFANSVPESTIAEREDFRNLICVTIDPETAEDFDDSISLTRDKAGNFNLGVHIADVSHYVRQGTALDTEARLRSNSTYFPGFCLPMIPKELSANLCSLRPEVNRLTISVLMTIDPTGEMIDYRITRSTICSAKRFTYGEALEVLEGKKKSPHAAMLKLMTELCALFKKKRYERGSIEFALPELVVKVDENGVPTGTRYIAYDITHQMIEEFMLKANETIATHLDKEGKGLPYRVHEEPSEENMRDFATLTTLFGFPLSETPKPRELQEFFDEALQTDYGPFLAVSYIRRMKMALYSPANIGHYGLGLSHYSHFTSPIRRYIDLIIHRILFGEEESHEELDRIATQCSEQERISAKAEGSVLLLKKLRLLTAMHEKEPSMQHKAVITQVKPFGITFEIPDLMLEGFIHVSEMGNDYYIYDDAGQKLYGSRGGENFLAGNPILVMVKEIDLIFLQAKWHFVGSLNK